MGNSPTPTPKPKPKPTNTAPPPAQNLQSVDELSKNKLCCMACFVFGFVILNTIAFITACIDIDQKCNDNLNLYASFILISGVMMTITVVMVFCVKLLAIGRKQKNGEPCLGAFVLSFYCIMIMLSCLGIIVYSFMNEECKITPLGQILFVYSVSYLTIQICGVCVPICIDLYAKRKEKERQPLINK